MAEIFNVFIFRKSLGTLRNKNGLKIVTLLFLQNLSENIK